MNTAAVSQLQPQFPAKAQYYPKFCIQYVFTLTKKPCTALYRYVLSHVLCTVFNWCVFLSQKSVETEDQQSEGQVVANPEQYIKHPLQNRWELSSCCIRQDIATESFNFCIFLIIDKIQMTILPLMVRKGDFIGHQQPSSHFTIILTAIWRLFFSHFIFGNSFCYVYSRLITCLFTLRVRKWFIFLTALCQLIAVIQARSIVDDLFRSIVQAV